MLDGELIGKNLQSMAQAIPNAQEYGLDDVYRERSASFSGPLLGMGEATQRSHNLGRYHYAINCWFSGLMRGKGPRWHTQTSPVPCAPLLGFVEARHGTAPNEATFAYGGRSVLRRIDDSTAGWVVSRDAGAGSTLVHESAVRFTHAGAGATDNLYVAGRAGPTDPLGELWKYDGTTWTKAPVPARFLCKVNDRLIRGWGNQISTCAGDPMVDTNWTAGLSVGDGLDLISGLGAAGGTLYVFTRTGRVFTLNATGTYNDLFPGLARNAPSDPLDAPGGQVTEWLSNLWFRSGDAFYQLSPSGGGASIQEVGAGRLVDNAGPVMGPPQAFAGHQAWYGFLGLWNPLNGNSYLLQYGDWVPQQGGEDPGFRFVDTLHGSLVEWVGKRVTSLYVDDKVAGNPRLYGGFADGALGYAVLPRTGPNPFAREAAVEFTPEVSYVQWPLHTLLAAADTKEWVALAVYGPRVTAADPVRVRYRIDPTALPLAGMGPTTDLVPDFTGPGQEWDFPPDRFGTALSLEEVYPATGLAGAAGSPIVLATVLRERLHPRFRLEWTWRAIGGNRVARRDGLAARQTADQILERCRLAAAEPKTVVVETPEETVGGWSTITYQQTLLPETQRYGTEFAVDMSFVGFKTEQTYGTIDRLGDLSIDGLGARTIDDLGTI